MPFSHVRNRFQPEQVDELPEAFNLVWTEIRLANGAATFVQLEQLRRRVANFLVACASNGDFTPEN